MSVWVSSEFENHPPHGYGWRSDPEISAAIHCVEEAQTRDPAVSI